ncbi:hypothetical protein [Chryseobacterium salviniae]|uniref:GLPGLI family protein n=1 Tax=Chryseobacterium salviniae TaxID=3101750 RepID=A0ABU6HRT9_9FLAO|nr:hypothetical protein [Chryseobacterium sp. T9W2-O]MEC3875623.1 hypothetical protein [Chryseobacterium sp. T9W2-O]
MKKRTLLFFFIFISVNIFSQHYEFNYYIRSKIENTGTKYIQVEDNLLNSNEKSYFAKINDAYEKGFREITVFDYKRELIHFFRIKSTGNIFESKNYTYYYSAYLIIDNSEKDKLSKLIYKQNDISSDSGVKKVTIEKYKKATSQKPQLTITAEMKRSKGDLRNLAIMFLMSTPFPYINFEAQDNVFISHADMKINKADIKLDSEILDEGNLELVVRPYEIKLPKEKPGPVQDHIENILKGIKK